MVPAGKSLPSELHMRCSDVPENCTSCSCCAGGQNSAFSSAGKPQGAINRPLGKRVHETEVFTPLFMTLLLWHMGTCQLRLTPRFWSGSGWQLAVGGCEARGWAGRKTRLRCLSISCNGAGQCLPLPWLSRASQRQKGFAPGPDGRPRAPYSGTNLGRSGSASAMKRWTRASASASVSPGPIAETKRISAPSARPIVRLS